MGWVGGVKISVTRQIKMSLCFSFFLAIQCEILLFFSFGMSFKHETELSSMILNQKMERKLSEKMLT